MSASFDSKTIRYSLGYSDEYMTVYNAFGTKPTSQYAGYQNTMVNALVSGGYWARMDLLYIFANNTNSNALINWINPGTFNADAVHDPVFTAWNGYSGDGAADYISTNWIPDPDAENYTGTSATYGIYTLTADIQEDMYIFGGQTANYFQHNYNGTSARGVINAGAFSFNHQNSSGLFIMSRTGTTIETYKNGTSVDTETGVSGGSLSTTENFILRRNVAATYSTNEVAIYFVMNAVTDGEALAISNIINAYMTAVGSNTY